MTVAETDSPHKPRTYSEHGGTVLRCDTCDTAVAFYGPTVVVTGGLISQAMEAHRAKADAPTDGAPSCDAGYAHSDPVWPESAL